MCARRPAHCPTCGESLYWLANQCTECLNRHPGRIADIPVPDGHDLVSRYHSAGRSHVMVRRQCARCSPI